MPWWGWIGVGGAVCTLALVALWILAWAAKLGDERREIYEREWAEEARELKAERLRRTHASAVRSEATSRVARQKQGGTCVRY